MSNLIDRQVAISEIMEDIKDRSLHDDPATPEDYAEGYDEGIRNAAAIVLQMPSAQPVNIANLQPNCNQVASDCISRQAALDFACAMNACDEISDDAYQKLTVHFENMPSAQPEWIPVTERLPKPNEEDGNGFHKAYLVQDGRWMDVARWDGKYWVAWGYSTVLLNVVAWCELPKPWEGDANGKD